MIRILFVSAVDPYSEEENRLKPLWPAYLAAYIEKELVNYDLKFYYTTKNIKKAIINYRPHIIGLSSVSQNFNYAIKYAKIAKQFDLPVIIGGMHISSLPNSLTREMDIGVLGEGEKTFLQLVKIYLKSSRFPKEHLKKIDGLVFNHNGHLVQTRARSPFSSIDEIPHPKRSLIGYQKRAYLYTTRGCAYNCVFCACAGYWGQVRFASPGYIIEEIDELINHGVQKIRFNDENFSLNKNRLHQLVQLIRARGFHKKVKFTCWSRANDITEDVVMALKSINVVSIKLGLESGSKKILDYLKGNVSIDNNIRAVNLIHQAGIQVNGDFIIGTPDETKDDLEQTYRFIKKVPLSFVDINIFTPFPATPVWEYAKKMNMVSDTMDWSRLCFKFKLNKDKTIILSKNFTYSQLKKIHKRFQFLRIIKAIKAIPNCPWVDDIPKVFLKHILYYVVLLFRRLHVPHRIINN